MCAEKNSATVKALFKIDAVKGDKHKLLYNPYALMKTTYDKKIFKLVKQVGHYEVHCLKDGKYELVLEFIIPVQVKNEVHSLSLKRADSFSHNLNFELNEMRLDL